MTEPSESTHWNQTPNAMDEVRKGSEPDASHAAASSWGEPGRKSTENDANKVGMDDSGPNKTNLDKLKELMPAYAEQGFPKPRSIISCLVCGEFGHRGSECTVDPNDFKKCHVCGITGHVKRTCPHKDEEIVCHRCQAPGHHEQNCPEPKVEEPCKYCKQTGHHVTCCALMRRNYRAEVAAGRLKMAPPETVDDCAMTLSALRDFDSKLSKRGWMGNPR